MSIDWSVGCSTSQFRRAWLSLRMFAQEAMYLIYVNHQSFTSSCRSQVEEGFIPEDMIDECTKRRQELIGKTKW